MRTSLDKIDIKILSILAEEGRIQNQQLADKVHLSPGACSQRLRRLEKGKYINSYSADINFKQVCDVITLFAVVKLSEQGSLKQVQLLRALEGIPEVIDCYEIAGDADFLVQFSCASLNDYHECVSELLSDTNLGIKKIESHIVLRHLSKMKRSNLCYLIDKARDN